MDGILSILNSSFVNLVAGAAIAAIGLFTWQRKDWEFKEQYQRNQVLLDRQLDLVETINKDIGKLVALADSISAPILKGAVNEDQTSDSIRSYNEFQSSWFGQCEAYKATLAFYFSPEVVQSFAHVVDMTGIMDGLGSTVRSQDGAKKMYDAGLAVYNSLRTWNAKVLAQIKGGPRNKKS